MSVIFNSVRKSIRQYCNEFCIADFSMVEQFNKVKETFLINVVCMKGENI